jgi:hypothetical protein
MYKVRVSVLRKNLTNALIYFNTTLFTLLHCYMFHSSGGTGTFREQGQQNPVGITGLYDFSPLVGEASPLFVLRVT